MKKKRFSNLVLFCLFSSNSIEPTWLSHSTHRAQWPLELRKWNKIYENLGSLCGRAAGRCDVACYTAGAKFEFLTVNDFFRLTAAFDVNDCDLFRLTAAFDVTLRVLKSQFPVLFGFLTTRKYLKGNKGLQTVYLEQKSNHMSFRKCSLLSAVLCSLRNFMDKKYTSFSTTIFDILIVNEALTSYWAWCRRSKNWQQERGTK